VEAYPPDKPLTRPWASRVFLHKAAGEAQRDALIWGNSRHRVVDGAQVGCVSPVRVEGEGTHQEIPIMISLCVLGVTLGVFAVKE